MLSVGKFKTEDEAISLANETNYGLGAGVHSSEYSLVTPPLQLNKRLNCMRIIQATLTSACEFHPASRQVP